MSTHTVRSDIILQGQSDWELWIFIVKRIAEAGDVWEYIDPNKPANPLQSLFSPLGQRLSPCRRITCNSTISARPTTVQTRIAVATTKRSKNTEVFEIS
ncbi:hypothetical protein KJE20_14096 [Pyrenophora tritici-repentis]|nr:hypothetical protein KJE20_14096 [Pyrenophora tritici-repentis]